MQTDALIADPQAGSTRGWQLERDLSGFYAVTGVFQTSTSFYSSIGFGTGAPKNAPDHAIKSVSQGPLTLLVARVGEKSNFGWAVQAGGDGSGMTTSPWDLVLAAHPSHSVTVAGLFNVASVFGDKVSEQLAPADSGSPFVVHVNSEEEYDYCP
jgi:hypothetical protein